MLKQIFRNIATNYLRMVFGILSALLLVPLIIGKLGPESFGIWVLCNTIAGYFSLTDLGVTSAAIKYISHYRAIEDWEELNKVIATSFLFFCLVATTVLLVAAGVAQAAPLLFHISSNSLQDTRTLIYLMGTIAAIGFMSTIPMQCVIAAQRQDLLNCWMLAVQILSTLLSIALVYLGHGIVSLGVIQLCTQICYAVISVALTRKYLPQAQYSIRWYQSCGFLIVSFAGCALATTLACKVIYSLDAIIIAHFISATAVAAYGIAMKISDVIKAVVGAGVGVLGTFVCELNAVGESAALSRMWLEGTKWSLAITLPICLLCVISGKDLITTWVGHAEPACVTVLAVLAIAALLDMAQTTGFQILVNAGHVKLYATVLSIEAAMNLALSISLIRIMGIVGVAIGTLLPLIVRTTIVCPYLMSKYFDTGPTVFCSKSIFPAIRAATLSLLAILIYRILGLHTGKMSLFCLGLLLIPCQLAGVYWFCLSKDQRVIVNNRIADVIKERFRPATIEARIPEPLSDATSFSKEQVLAKK